jgi:hypothetical protein
MRTSGIYDTFRCVVGTAQPHVSKEPESPLRITARRSLSPEREFECEASPENRPRSPTEDSDASDVTISPSVHVPSASASTYATLLGVCDHITAQYAQALSLQALLRQRNELQAKLDAAEREATDFGLIVKLGRAVKSKGQEIAEQPLSEEDLGPLADRCAAQVRKITAACRELVKAQDYDALEVMNGRLKTLQALQLPALTSPALPSRTAKVILSSRRSNAAL